MELTEFISKQTKFDKEHGWDTSIIPEVERLQSLERELVGLMGEVGEVANIVKKARLSVLNNKSSSTAFRDIVPEVNEELIDVFIYLLRLFQVAGTDIESEYLRKLAINKERFKKYENATP